MPFCKHLNLCSTLSLLCIVLTYSRSFVKESHSKDHSQMSRRLLLVQSLFRHGDRAPLVLYPNDPNKADSWPEGQGHLTQLGKKQLYAVGKFLRTMYKDFVTSNPNEVFAFSAPKERSMSSALAHLAALYAPKGRWKFEDKLNWQPIPVYTLPVKNNTLLCFESDCPRANAIFDKLAESVSTTKVFRKYQILLETLSVYSGFNLSEGLNALWLCDNLTSEKIHNLIIPEWANKYGDELLEIERSSFNYLVDQPTLLRLRIGPLFQKIAETMKKKIDGEIPDFKYSVYSAHDLNVGGVLVALNFRDLPRPPVCATLLFELHEMTDSTKAVRLLYLNSTDPIKHIGKPHVLVLDDCSEFCPFENFIKKIQRWIPDNLEQECKLDTSDAFKTDKTVAAYSKDIAPTPILATQQPSDRQSLFPKQQQLDTVSFFCTRLP